MRGDVLSVFEPAFAKISPHGMQGPIAILPLDANDIPAEGLEQHLEQVRTRMRAPPPSVRERAFGDAMF